MKPLDQFYAKLEEPEQSCLLALRQVLVNFDPNISEEWKYKLPFFYLNKKPFCYFWFHKKYQQPYIGIVKGHLVNHPLLLQEKRKQMKILLANPNTDLPLADILEVLELAKSVHRPSKI